MYTRRAALATSNSLRPFLKVCRTNTPDFPYTVKAIFVRNFAIASERSGFHGSVAQNNFDYPNHNRNDGYSHSNSGGFVETQTPSRVYGQNSNSQLANYASADTGPSRNHLYTGGYEDSNCDRTLGGAKQNLNYSGFSGGNVNYNGYGNGSTQNSGGSGQWNSKGKVSSSIKNHGDTVQWDSRGQVSSSDQNHGGTSQWDSRGQVSSSAQNHGDRGQWDSKGQISTGNVQMSNTNYGGNQNGSSEMPQYNASNTAMCQQNNGGVHYSNYGNYQQNWNQNWGDKNIDSRASGDSQSNVAPVDVPKEIAPKRKIEDLDDLIKESKLKEAVELLELLKEDGLEVDMPRYIELIKACGENETLEEAKSVHTHLLKSYTNIDVKTFNKILEMYSKCGSMDDASQVFDQIPGKSLTSWDVMISGLAKNGLGEDSIELFTEFKKLGLKPDGILFNSVFSACGALSDTIEGMLHFESMTKEYGIVPSMENYISIVDMFGTAGYLNEALEFIENMPVEPNTDIWETLMKFCRIHGNTELGDRCTELIELIEPSRLDAQSKEGLIPIDPSVVAREKAKKKVSVKSMLDVRSRVHEYRAGDRSHPDQEKIYEMLRGLRHHMKEVGYVPETRPVLHDVDVEAKEEALMAHSERLAAAQGFMTTAARSPLRIIKNLRVCVDCHNAFKIITTIVGRQIIARDSKRFHHFENGVCTCNDYW